jgi:hypothetical protein
MITNDITFKSLKKKNTDCEFIFGGQSSWDDGTRNCDLNFFLRTTCNIYYSKSCWFEI